MIDKITEIDEAWNKQKEVFREITTEATKNYLEQEALINYLEEQMLRIPCSPFSATVNNQARYISVEMSSLNLLHDHFSEYLAVVEPLIRRGDLLKLFEHEEKLMSFAKKLKSLEYLVTFSEDDIYNMYYPSILSDNSFPFLNFTQNNRDTYIRLKFRALNESKKSQL